MTHSFAWLIMPDPRAVFTAGSGGKGDILSLRPLSERSVVYARDGSVLAVLIQ